MEKEALADVPQSGPDDVPPLQREFEK